MGSLNLSFPPLRGDFILILGQTMAIPCLLLLLCTLVGTQAYDEDMVDDIFGEGGQQVQQQYEAREIPQPETRCDELRACVECSVFHQYWKHYASAFECHQECSRYTFINEPSEGETMCTMQYEPHCGIDGKTYANQCQAHADGVGVACRGECPCPSDANVCNFQGNLDGDTICRAYKFVIEESLRRACIIQMAPTQASAMRLFLTGSLSSTGSPHLPHLLRVARAREETKEDRQNMSKREKDSFTTQ